MRIVRQLAAFERGALLVGLHIDAAVKERQRRGRQRAEGLRPFGNGQPIQRRHGVVRRPGHEPRRTRRGQGVGRQRQLRRGQQRKAQRRRIGQFVDLLAMAVDRVDQRLEDEIAADLLVAHRAQAQSGLVIVAAQGLAGDQRLIPPRIAIARHAILHHPARARDVVGGNAQFNAIAVERLAGTGLRQRTEQRRAVDPAEREQTVEPQLD